MGATSFCSSKVMTSPLTIIVPAYNEAENFPLFWKELTSAVKSNCRVVVVYDFDQDTTVPVVQALIDEGAKNLCLAKNEIRRGVVGAIRTGFGLVTEGPVLVAMADLSDDLALVDRMFDLYRRGYCLVAASRYMPGGRIIGGPLLKKNLSRLAGLSLHWLRGVPTRDATNAFKLYDAALLKTIQIESTAGFEISLEITVKAFLAGWPMIEIPVTWRDRTHGKSRFRLRSWLPRYLRWYAFAFQAKRPTSGHKFAVLYAAQHKRGGEPRN